jgi:hypothetical protein
MKSIIIEMLVTYDDMEYPEREIDAIDCSDVKDKSSAYVKVFHKRAKELEHSANVYRIINSFLMDFKRDNRGFFKSSRVCVGPDIEEQWMFLSGPDEFIDSFLACTKGCKLKIKQVDHDDYCCHKD